MITPDKVKDAFNALGEADNEQYLAEEARIEAAQARERSFLAGMDEAIADGVRDQAALQKKGERASRKQLAALQKAEKASRKAAHAYRQAGIMVDSLNRQMEAAKLTMCMD